MGPTVGELSSADTHAAQLASRCSGDPAAEWVYDRSSRTPLRWSCAISSSPGSLTSPPLTAVAVTLMGSRALGALEVYAAQDRANGGGACGFAPAAAEHLGRAIESVRPTSVDRADFDALLAVAARLRSTE